MIEELTRLVDNLEHEVSESSYEIVKLKSENKNLKLKNGILAAINDEDQKEIERLRLYRWISLWTWVKLNFRSERDRLRTINSNCEQIIRSERRKSEIIQIGFRFHSFPHNDSFMSHRPVWPIRYGYKYQLAKPWYTSGTKIELMN